ncbi:MAG: lysostaphin resistance A-like protein [Flavobacteriales bacterium]
MSLITDEKIKNTSHRIILFCGVFFLVLGIVGMGITSYFEINTNYVIDKENPFVQKIAQYPPLVFLTAVLIISPCVEELSFRYWLKRTNFSILVSYFGVLGFIFLATDSSLFLLCSVVFFYISFFILYKKKNKQTLGFFLSSVVFALVHLGKSNFSWNTSFIILYLFGMGLLLSFICTKFGFRYAIFGHFINNLLASLPLFIFLGSNVVIIEGKTYRAEISPTFPIAFSEKLIIAKDSMTIIGHPFRIGVQIAPYNNKIHYLPIVHKLRYVDMRVKSIEQNQIDKEDLLFKFLEKMDFKLDTFVRKALVLGVDKSGKSQQNAAYRSSLYDFILYLRNKYNLPLILKEGTIEESILIPNAVLKAKSFEEVLTLMNGYILIDTTVSNHELKYIQLHY